METATGPSAPISPDVVIPKPESGLSRKPQALSRNFEQRVKQLSVIAENPTQAQVRTLADKISSDNPEDSGDAEEMAINSFKNMASLIKERDAIEREVKQKRKAALSASSGDFKTKVAALREAEVRRGEITAMLRTFSTDFIEAGVEMDPSQIPLALGDKLGQKIGEWGAGAKEIALGVSHKAQEAGSQVAAGAGYAKGRVGSGLETVKEAGVKLAEAGRGGLRRLMETVTGSLNRAQESGQATFEDLRFKAETTGGRASSEASKLGEVFKNVREGISQKMGGVWEAASVWTNQRRQEIAQKVTTTSENIGLLFSRSRTSAGERVEAFNRVMTSVGESARSRWDNASESVRNFASEQAKRVEAVTVQVGSRIRAEVSMAIEKGKILLAPAWESIQRDRERMRMERDVYGEKLGIIMEGVSDVASPVIDRILDEARDLRDGALGFGRKQIQGLQVFGRDLAGKALDTASPAWQFLNERWENLRLRSNESRIRLNTFMEAVLGKAGIRFSMLRESVAERAKRAGSVLSGARIEGGRILQNGVEVSKHTAEWFAQNGTTAKEFLLKRKEQVAQGVHLLQRFWEQEAVRRWQEAGKSPKDVGRLLKMMRGSGAASLGRAASISTAAGIEGAVMLQRLAGSNKGRLALSVAALGIALAVNPELRDGLQSLFGGVQLPDFGVQAGGPDFSAPSMPGGVDAAGSVPAPLSASDIAPSQIMDTGGIGAVTESGSAAVSTPGQTPSFDASQNIPAEATAELPAIDNGPAGAVSAPELAGGPSVNADMFTPGQPLEEQARQLAGGVNENYYNYLQSGFDHFKDNFQNTAQWVVDHASNFTPDEVSLAQQQIEAGARLNQDPSLVQGSQEWYDTIMKATRFWKP